LKFLLDTNTVIGLVARQPKLVAAVRRHAPHDFGVSAIGVHELFFGAYKSPRQPQNLAALARLQFDVIEFDREDARQAGEIRAALAAMGGPIGPYDVLIAGQARARDLVLVTRNVGEFSRVNGLQVEDWGS
jgi:tRNA(fMet)-specific endonuclease VapC